MDRANRFGVAPDIHPDDYIFKFLIANECFHSKDDAVNYYFSDGQASSKKFSGLVSKFLPPVPGSPPLSILEFASGYGCVSRHLVKQFGRSVTPCDIHPAASAFLKEKIGMEPLQSTRQPEAFAPGKSFDIVFALSFFSHMPHATWARWLHTLFNAVRPGGLLIFTTHGLISGKFFGNPALNADGYWFRAESEQKDLDVTQYGQMIVTPAYVFGRISTLPEASICFFERASWWGHQDTYVVQKKTAIISG